MPEEKEPQFEKDNTLLLSEVEKRESRKKKRKELIAPKWDREKVEEMKKHFEETMITKKDVGWRDEEKTAYHETCNTNLVLPNKRFIEGKDVNIYRAIKEFRVGQTSYAGFLYCPKCNSLYEFYVEH